jgi:hypothetical protein
MIRLFSDEEPYLYKQFRESGALDKLKKEQGTVVGYLPFCRARQAATITGIMAIILLTFNLPEKVVIIGSCIVLIVTSLVLRNIFLKEMARLRIIHNQITINSGRIK